MTGAWTQLRALVALRWQMTRAAEVRFTLTLLPFVVLWLLYAVTALAPTLEPAAMSAAIELAPTAFLGFGFLAIVAPLTAGGGNELIPSGQLVAYPVRPRTQFLGALVLAPVNLVWVLQILVLAAETSYLTDGSNELTGTTLTVLFILCMTVVGQALAWAVVGLRQTRRGRQSIAVLTALAAVAVAALARSGHAREALRYSPTRTVVRALTSGLSPLWVATMVCMLAGSGLALLGGARLCGWALARPTDATGAATGRSVRRRRPGRTVLDELIAVDRASVWRSTALRRGGLVLALLPSLVALGGAIPWQTLVVLPGLVAAGAGLLFGVNAFSLDGSGAVWLASLPHDPRLQARAKLSVLTETVFAAVVIAAFTGSLRSPGWPTSAEVSAITMSGLACGALVIATCMALSVRRPHKAELNGPRDAIAPPGALAAASARLALPAGAVGLVLEGASTTGLWWLPLVVGTPVVLVAWLWLRRSLSAYAEVLTRSRVVQTVSAG